MAVSDIKHTERVPVNFTEREFLDICREAARIDKKPAEYIRFMLRKCMYGSVGMIPTAGNESNSDFGGLS